MAKVILGKRHSTLGSNLLKPAAVRAVIMDPELVALVEGGHKFTEAETHIPDACFEHSGPGMLDPTPALATMHPVLYRLLVVCSDLDDLPYFGGLVNGDFRVVEVNHPFRFHEGTCEESIEELLDLIMP